MTYVRPGAPPFHIAHGTRDRFVPFAQSRELADALRAAGVPVEAVGVEGADHGWADHPDPAGIFESAVEFIIGNVRSRP